MENNLAQGHEAEESSSSPEVKHQKADLLRVRG